MDLYTYLKTERKEFVGQNTFKKKIQKFLSQNSEIKTFFSQMRDMNKPRSVCVEVCQGG